jgi:hypothetical protein
VGQGEVTDVGGVWIACEDVRGLFVPIYLLSLRQESGTRGGNGCGRCVDRYVDAIFRT